MLLPSVSETLASVSRHPALEAAISALRRGVAHEHVAGLTDTAKALVAAHVAAELRRPVIVLVTSGAGASTSTSRATATRAGSAIVSFSKIVSLGGGERE